jgi:hypothetical protein
VEPDTKVQLLQPVPTFFMVAVAQLVRVPDCDSGGRGFETRQPPQNLNVMENNMLRGTRILSGDEARLYNKVVDTLRGCLHRG